ncbi:CLUMA_CG013182, isoform A [Clunio marinus]|uniref:CLUMA_CG013182, isoform A n=1 Tax=Clunio marinus TaxID=568069 RepID=A0A1J1ILC3_9DIPT|nr:CLUMA_CG013182, isoform A [Clunio marinus]
MSKMNQFQFSYFTLTLSHYFYWPFIQALLLVFRRFFYFLQLNILLISEKVQENGIKLLGSAAYVLKSLW